MEENLDSAIKILTRWQSISNEYASSDGDNPRPSLFDRHNREEVLEFLAATKDLQASITQPNSPNTSSKKLTSAQNLLRSTMKRLGREFFTLLKAYRDHLPPNIVPNSDNLSDDESSGHNSAFGSGERIDKLLEGSNDAGVNEVSSAMDDLKLLAECMMDAGYGKKCLKIYRITRRSIVENSMFRLGAKKLTKSGVQKWDLQKIQSNMDRWLKVARFAVKNIFLGEKILADYLFSSSCSLPLIKDTCFADVCKDSAVILLNFPGKIAKHSKKSPDMIFRYLDLHVSFTELSADIDMIFGSELVTSVRSESKSSFALVTDGIRSVLSEFESQVQKDASKVVVPRGAVHPLTQYVMSYLTSLEKYTDTLETVLDECYDNLKSCLPGTYFEDGTTSSPASLWFAWQILLLLCKLNAKSEVYKDSALSYLFLANNVQYVVNKVTSSKLETVLGETWVPNHISKVMQHAVEYEKAGWNKVISTLPEDANADMPIDMVKECFKKFNVLFEEEYRKQVDWYVLDKKLKDEMKATLTKKVLERYRYMYDTYKLDLAKNRSKGIIETSIKFTPEEVENYMSDILDGQAADVDDIPSLSGEGGQAVRDNARRRKRLSNIVRLKK